MQFEVGINKTSIPLRVMSGNLVFHSGSLVLEEIEFEGELQGNDGGEKVVEIDQVTTIDFASGNATPALPDIVLESGTYEELEFSIDLFEGADTPPLVITGDYTHSNNEVIPIRFEYDGDELFEIDAEQVTLSDDQNLEVRLLLDPVFWFSTVPTNLLDNAILGPDNVILVSEDSNSDIYEIVVSRMKLNSAANFF